MTQGAWAVAWRGRWIWVTAPPPAEIWGDEPAGTDTFVYLRRVFNVKAVSGPVPARATCDSRYVLYLNGQLLGRGPVRDEPEHLGWDEHDLAPLLRVGPNVLVALCRYYARQGPWWVPAHPVGTLGRGSFCFETAEDCGIDVATDELWRAVDAPWVPQEFDDVHGVPPEVVDGRLAPAGLHDPEAELGTPVVVLRATAGTVVDRPPAAPYSAPLQRPIPQLTSRMIGAESLEVNVRVAAELLPSPPDTWRTVRREDAGDRRLSVWDLGGLSLGHIILRTSAGQAGGVVDVVGGEELRPDGLPEIRVRNWGCRFIAPEGEAEVTFYDPIGLRYIAVHHPAGVTAVPAMEETVYPRPAGAAFDCDDERFNRLWNVGGRTLDLCSADAFLDCPSREQRAWLGDAYVETLVSFVCNPDWRLVRHHLQLAARSRRRDGLLGMAAGCDAARSGFTIPEYSLHWIRALVAYWWYSGDEALVRSLLPVIEGIIDRYEVYRGPSGLLESFPGWIYIDWAQIDRDVVTGAHDAIYAAALRDLATLPGAPPTDDLVSRTATGFEALWDADREVYVDAMGDGGPSRRVSQHTNGAALLADVVPHHRVPGLIDRVIDPGGAGMGGRPVITDTSAEWRPDVPPFMYSRPKGFDPERDVAVAQPFFARLLHEALVLHNRRDVLIKSLLRWCDQSSHGTFQEFWRAEPGTSSRCHGWAASPTYDLTSYILGVRPAEPGYRSVLVDPYLGPLRRASGRVPTPHGWITVAVEGAGDEVEVEVDAPEGVDVRVGRPTDRPLTETIR